MLLSLLNHSGITLDFDLTEQSPRAPLKVLLQRYLIYR